jgi:hypothetical protein
VFRDLKISPTTPVDHCRWLTPRQRRFSSYSPKAVRRRRLAPGSTSRRERLNSTNINLMESLKLQSSAELIHFAIKNGIVAI